MNTSKPIATITWNTIPFLRMKLDDLIKSKIISFWAFAPHKGEESEDDEGGKKKDHIHLYLEPTKRIQTVDLVEHFIELDSTNKKPIKPLDFRPSKWSDWYLYGYHDKEYLLSKGKTRQYYYTPDIFQYSDENEAHYRIAQVNKGDLGIIGRMREAIKSGLDWDFMVSNGLIPINQLRNYFIVYQSITRVSGIPPAETERSYARSALHSAFVPAGENVPLPFDGDIKTMGTREDD